MASAIEKITLYAPIVASSGIFALRRAEKGLDAIDENPLYGAANLVIAGGQTLKGIRAAEDLTFAANPCSATENIKAASDIAKGASTSSKFLKAVGKVFDFTSKHVNPLICGASAIKVLGSDDKADAAVREILGLGTMFACENAAKALIGMPKCNINNIGKVEFKPRENAIYKEFDFAKKQIKAFEEYCETKKLFNEISLKSVPGALKGIIFVLASIGGYKLGSKLADLLLGTNDKKISKKESNNFIKNINNSSRQQEVNAT